MANQPETTTYETGIYQFETTDPVLGGLGGIDNLPLKQLANRTNYLKQHVDVLESRIRIENYDAAVTSLTAGTTATIGSMTYTTPNDGISRKYSLSFKCYTSNTTNELGFMSIIMKNDTLAVTLDTVWDRWTDNGTITLGYGHAACLSMQRIVTLAPNTVIKIIATSITGTTDIDAKSLIIIEL
jgi:hypothetical protein